MPDPLGTSDLLYWHEARLGGLYQDSGGTVTPATADTDPVGYMPDQSGNGYHLTQATSGNRPLYRTTIFNGYAGLSFSGTQYLTMGNPASFTPIQSCSMTRCYVVYPTNISGYPTLGGKASSGNARIWDMIRNSQFRRYEGAASGSQQGAIAANTYYVLCVQQDWVRSAASIKGLRERLWVNGQVCADTINFAPSWNTGNEWQIGAANGSFGFIGYMALDCCYYRGLTPAERERFHAYVARNYNLTGSRQPPEPYSRRIQVVCPGNSITRGASSDGNTFPCVAQQRYFLGDAGPWWNMGVDGTTTTALAGAAGTGVDQMALPGVLNILLYWEGTNEIAANTSAATAYANTASYCTARRALGWKVIVATVIDRNSTFSGGQTDAGFETARQTYNTSVRTNWATFADGLADFGNTGTITVDGISVDVSALGGASASASGTYFFDGTHLTPTGYDLVAKVAGYAVNALVKASRATVEPLSPSDVQQWAGTAVVAGAVPAVGAGASGGLLVVGTGSGAINPTGGKVPATLAGTDVTGNVPADIQTIKTQAVTAAAPVTFPASIGTSTYSGGAVASVTAPVSVADKTGFSLGATGLDAIPVTDPGGVADTFPKMVVQLWRRFFKGATKSATQIKTLADDGATVRTTQMISVSGSDETQGAAS